MNMDILEKKCVVSAVDVGTDRNIKPSALFDFFQNATTEHGDDLGVGLDMMLKNGQAWVLSRFSVLIERRPRFNETLTIKTWPQGFQRLLYMRNYDVLDDSGVILARASSSWIILDIERRRPLPPSALAVPIPLNEGRVFLEGGARSLEKRGGFVKTMERKALYSDIDFNGHVNNARYIQWIQDALQKDFLKNVMRLRIDVNYTGEVLFDETVEIYSNLVTPNMTALEGRRLTDNQAAFRAEIEIDG
ncbi:MAG: acyl-ACP thioesterase [Spirochaetaceae bacterium]|jgi:acyl-ACP thioesterase|nr:acyl-ACP thioesterase [Spirochaetaceae bacterium]